MASQIPLDIYQGRYSAVSVPLLIGENSGTDVASQNTAFPVWLNGEKDIYLDKVAFRIETGQDSATATLYYATDENDMDSSDTTGNEQVTAAVSIATANASTLVDAGLVNASAEATTDRVKIPAKALLWVKLSAALTAPDLLTVYFRGGDF
jgi:hypothetical protein